MLIPKFTENIQAGFKPIRGVPKRRAGLVGAVDRFVQTSSPISTDLTLAIPSVTEPASPIINANNYPMIQSCKESSSSPSLQYNEATVTNVSMSTTTTVMKQPPMGFKEGPSSLILPKLLYRRSLVF